MPSLVYFRIDHVTVQTGLRSLFQCAIWLSGESFRVGPNHNMQQFKAKWFFSSVSSLICAIDANESLALCVLTDDKRWPRFLTMALIASEISANSPFCWISAFNWIASFCSDGVEQWDYFWEQAKLYQWCYKKVIEYCTNNAVKNS